MAKTEFNPTPPTSGQCTNCHQTFFRQAMAAHLEKCTAGLQHSQTALDATPPQLRWYPAQLYTLLVTLRGAGDTYWLYLEAPKTNSLVKLDSFLRLVWLECCGHLQPV